MGVQKETLLQRRIQKLIKSRGGYVHKNWGNMTSEPGIADLTACYKGIYLALEVKEDDNTPSQAQGIHARMVDKSFGITCAVWSVEEAAIVLDCIDTYVSMNHFLMLDKIKELIICKGVDNGKKW